VTYKVRLTAEALEDLDRLYEFLLKRDLDAAERALGAIEHALALLAYSPYSCRKALLQKNPRWRELLIPFGHSGYAALFEIDDDRTSP
jgi:plasmid stabilization system protein ParE